MYEYIIGKLMGVTPSTITVEAGGIGYKLYVANPFRFSPSMEQMIKIHLHQVIREDAHALYGFKDEAEKELFVRLISVSGIGPKSALAILAAEDHLGLVQAVSSADVTYLTKFPGVGKKTAQQMILDLHDKLGEFAEGVDGVVTTPVPTVENEALEEAMEALKSLGYSAKELQKLKKSFKGDTLSTEEYIRESLKLLMKK